MYSELLPEIRDILGDRVDDMRDFITNYELDVLSKGAWYLGSQFVSHEQSIFDFYSYGP